MSLIFGSSVTLGESCNLSELWFPPLTQVALCSKLKTVIKLKMLFIEGELKSRNITCAH